MKKLILGLAIASIGSMGAIAQAAPLTTVGATGQIFFSGSVNANSCVIHDNGPGSAGGNINVDMGSVAMVALGTEAAPTLSGSSTVTTLPAAIDLWLECDGVAADSVRLTLTPNMVQGKGIGVTGGAQGVQIMLVDSSGAALDFTSGTADVDAALSSGKGAIDLSAYYTKTLASEADATKLAAGAANATVAYTLSYN